MCSGDSDRQQGLFPEDDPRHSLDELFQRSREYRNGRQYRALLDFIGRFPYLSPYNACLVRTQNPKVRFVASARRWRSRYGRDVQPEARPLIVLQPFGPVALVYDVEDTFGAPLPLDLEQPFRTAGRLQPAVWDNTLAHCAGLGIDVALKPDSRFQAGVAQHLFRNHALSIRINDALDLSGRYATLAHELAHILCGHLGRRNKDDPWPERHHIAADDAELEAESVSYLVCQRFGVRSYAEAYLAQYVDAVEALNPISLNTVLKVAGEIEGYGRKVYRGPKTGKPAAGRGESGAR